MSRTEQGTSDITDDDDGTSDSAGEVYEAPCREAARCVVACPRCGRQLQLKTLRYSHVCNRTFNVAERAVEQQKAAEMAAHARMSRVEQTREQNAHGARPIKQTQERAAERPREQTQRDYSNLLII